MNTKCLFADELGTRLRRSYLFRLLTGILATLLLCTCTAGATASPYKLCFNEVTGLPAPDGAGGFTFPLNPPAIDGEPDGDTGWTGAFRYVFQNGTNQPYGAFQA